MSIDTISIDEKKDYFQSPEFMKIWNIILGQKKVSAMDIEAGSQVIAGLDYDTFNKFCYSLYYCLDDKVVIEDDDQGYAFEHLDYRGYRFSAMSGPYNPWFYCRRIRR